MNLLHNLPKEIAFAYGRTAAMGPDVARGFRLALYTYAGIQAGRRAQGLAFDSAQWITVHPNGKGINQNGEDIKGQPVLIESETGEVLGGMGGKFTGRHISEATKKPEQASHVVRCGQEQRKDPKAFAKRVQQAKEMRLQQTKPASSASPASLDYKGSILDNLPFKVPGISVIDVAYRDLNKRVAGWNSHLLESSNAERKRLCDNTRQALLAVLNDGGWKPVNVGLNIKDRAQKAEFNRVQREVFAYDGLKFLAGSENTHMDALPAEVVKKGEHAKQVYADLRKHYAEQEQGKIEQGVKQALDSSNKAYSRALSAFSSGEDSDSMARELSRCVGEELVKLVSMASREADGKSNYKAWAELQYIFRGCQSNICNDPNLGTQLTAPNFIISGMRPFLAASAAVARLNAIEKMSDLRLSDSEREELQQTIKTAKKQLAAAKTNMLNLNGGCSLRMALERQYSKRMLSDSKFKNAKAERSPAAVGGVSNTGAMDFDAANELRGNPHYTNMQLYYFDEKGEKVYPYHINCQTSVVANEMRRRGYDVSAQANIHTQNSCSFLAKNCPMIWVDPRTGAAPDKIAFNDFSELSGIIQEGQRYHVEWAWDNWNEARGAHIITATREGGKCFLYDPQTGIKTRIDKMGDTNDRFYDGAGVRTDTLRAYRVDNCDIITDFANDVLTTQNAKPMLKGNGVL